MGPDDQDPVRKLSTTFEGSRSDADRAMATTRESAEHLSSVLSQTAEALEKSAELADEHAQRRARAGKPDDAAIERRAARSARQAAERARSQAAAYLELTARR